MKTKTDLYTKIVLTAIAVFLGIIVLKDTSLSSKASANKIDLSALDIEKTIDDEGTTFFIYENSKISEPFSNKGYSRQKTECEISYDDIPTYIITNKKALEFSSVKIKKTAEK